MISCSANNCLLFWNNTYGSTYLCATGPKAPTFDLSSGKPLLRRLSYLTCYHIESSAKSAAAFFFFLCFLVVISDELETRFAQFKEKKLLSQLSDPAWAEWHHAHLKENREEYKKLLREDWGSWNTKQDVSSVLHFWENECWCSLGHELYMVEQWFSISSVYYVLRIQGRIKLCAHQPGPTPKHFHFPATFPRKLLKKKSVNLVNVFVE